MSSGQDENDIHTAQKCLYIPSENAPPSVKLTFLFNVFPQVYKEIIINGLLRTELPNSTVIIFLAYLQQANASLKIWFSKIHPI
jgi:hypothetical protein